MPTGIGKALERIGIGDQTPVRVEVLPQDFNVMELLKAIGADGRVPMPHRLRALELYLRHKPPNAGSNYEARMEQHANELARMRSRSELARSRAFALASPEDRNALLDMANDGTEIDADRLDALVLGKDTSGK